MDGRWSIASVVSSGVPLVVDLAADEAWPVGAWKRSPAQALVVPIARPAGVFIAGVNPHRPLDKGLRGFVELFVGQLAAGLSSAHAYEAEKKRAEALAEIDRAKTAFFSNVSHEFRTPLTLMLAPQEDALGSGDRVLGGEDLRAVHRNTLRLLKLVNNLLDFSRIEAGRVEASYVPTDLSALTTDLTSAFRSAFERAGLKFEVECPLLPEPIFVDRDMWEKIVLNLLSNALKFTFDGTVRASLRIEGDHVELKVEDTGVGIPEHELPRLFERFHRVEGTRSRTHEGSGIGLSLVHDLVKLHGGNIQTASRPGQGTLFVVSIPTGSAHLPADRVGARRSDARTADQTEAYVTEALRWLPEGAAAQTGPATGGAVGSAATVEPAIPTARVLVADDNADMRDYLTRLLGAQWTVEAVADGAQALAAARERRPDVIVSDVMMPNLDGFGLLRALRGDPHGEHPGHHAVRARRRGVAAGRARSGRRRLSRQALRRAGTGGAGRDASEAGAGARGRCAAVAAASELARPDADADVDLASARTSLRVQQSRACRAHGPLGCWQDARRGLSGSGRKERVGHLRTGCHEQTGSGERRGSNPSPLGRWRRRYPVSHHRHATLDRRGRDRGGRAQCQLRRHRSSHRPARVGCRATGG